MRFDGRKILWWSHVFFGKPVSTFPRHALCGIAALLHSEIPPSQGTIRRKSSSAALALA
jgi:hypothetical protein